MSPYSWGPSNYLCPECETRLESKGGPDGLNAQRCPSCKWEKVYDPAADEFAVKELDRVQPVTDGGQSEPGVYRCPGCGYEQTEVCVIGDHGAEYACNNGDCRVSVFYSEGFDDA